LAIFFGFTIFFILIQGLGARLEVPSAYLLIPDVLAYYAVANQYHQEVNLAAVFAMLFASIPIAFTYEYLRSKKPTNQEKKRA
jgi:hypothetical protein